jgi:ATP-dependent exoDNAse (exonuclease V) beta subunit
MPARKMSEVAILRSESGSLRPGGARFGTLVHLVLRDALSAEAADLDPLTEFHARILGATPEERDAARAATGTALGHPLMTRARNAERCHGEYPLVLRTGEEILEGIVDLAFFESGTWHVIDFKTDLGASDGASSTYRAERLALYIDQVNRYRFMFESVTRLPTEGYLFGV